MSRRGWKAEVGVKLPALGYGLTLDRPVVVTVGPRSMHIKVKDNAPPAT